MVSSSLIGKLSCSSQLILRISWWGWGQVQGYIFRLLVLANGWRLNQSLKASGWRKAWLKLGPDKAEDKKWPLRNIWWVWRPGKGITPAQGPESRGCMERSLLLVLILSPLAAFRLHFLRSNKEIMTIPSPGLRGPDKITRVIYVSSAQWIPGSIGLHAFPREQLLGGLQWTSGLLWGRILSWGLLGLGELAKPSRAKAQ